MILDVGVHLVVKPLVPVRWNAPFSNDSPHYAAGCCGSAVVVHPHCYCFRYDPRYVRSTDHDPKND